MNTVGYFEIQAGDPKRAVAFYSSIFGWKFTLQPGLPIEYYRIESAGINGGLLARPVPSPTMPAGTNAYCCSIEVADLDRTATAILNRGGIIAMAKFAVPGRCWQGYFLDTEGNVFGVFQVDANAK